MPRLLAFGFENVRPKRCARLDDGSHGPTGGRQPVYGMASGQDHMEACVYAKRAMEKVSMGMILSHVFLRQFCTVATRISMRRVERQVQRPTTISASFTDEAVPRHYTLPLVGFVWLYLAAMQREMVGDAYPFCPPCHMDGVGPLDSHKARQEPQQSPCPLLMWKRG